MVGKLIALALACCLATPTMAAWPGRSGKPYAGKPPAGAYVGPGDILGNHQAWYGVRAYKSSSRGQMLMEVCDSDLVANTDTACANIFSSASTGAIVPITVGGITCPMPAGTTDDWNTVGNAGYAEACTIKIAYDLSGHGIDVSSSAANERPYLMNRAVPILDVDQSLACMYYPDNFSFLKSAAQINWALPITINTFLMNQAPVAARIGNNGPPSNLFAKTIALRPTSGLPALSFQPSAQGLAGAVRMNAGTIAHAPANPGGNFPLSPAGQPYVMDHYPHAVQAIFSASGTTSSAYVDGLNYPNMNTGNTTPGMDTIELGAADTLNNHFDGVICELGIAAGDQNAKNKTINDNQTAYFEKLSPTPTYTTIFDQTVNFNNRTPGTRYNWPEQNADFNQFKTWTNANYTVTSAANSPMCAGGLGYTGVESCVPASKQAFTIVADGKDGTPALQIMLPQGSFGYGIDGYGNGQMNFGFGYPPGSPGTVPLFNVIDYEYDIMFRSAATAPNHLDFDLTTIGKHGIQAGFVNAAGGDETTTQLMWAGFSTSPMRAYLTTNLGGDQVGEGETTGGQAGFNQVGIWYHTHIQTALGPNGWTMIWMDDGSGTAMRLRNASSRQSPYRSNGAAFIGGMSTASHDAALLNYPFRRWDILPHFGGQGESAAKNDSYYVYDNFHIRGLMRQ